MSEEKYLKALQKYSSNLLSNTKWIKLFTAIDNDGIETSRSIWTFIDKNQALTYPLPKIHDLNEIRFNDGKFQPFAYKWILEIFIPNEYKPYNDIGLIKKIKNM